MTIMAGPKSFHNSFQKEEKKEIMEMEWDLSLTHL